MFLTILIIKMLITYNSAKKKVCFTYSLLHIILKVDMGMAWQMEMAR